MYIKAANFVVLDQIWECEPRQRKRKKILKMEKTGRDSTRSGFVNLKRYEQMLINKTMGENIYLA